MRLKQIQLAGFKSFVEPVTLPLHTQKAAVVGPNGCGKSNLVDAVRWVIGENSTKLLRAGTTLEEVIFKGSKHRQPVGQATVELRFDNSDGMLGGQYAQFNEIAIRRTLYREGESQYFLNGTRCRRRDVVDVFLGTGLGPQSYAIIEQGMITHLIQAKPEALRGYLEEVSGISKYKERRKDTERRMQATRENLERLNDLRSEVDQQAERLQKQAHAARRYKQLMQHKRYLEAQSDALHWTYLDQSVQANHRQISDMTQALEAMQAKRTELDDCVQTTHQRIDALNEPIQTLRDNEEAHAETIARLEEKLTYQKRRRDTLQQQWDTLMQSWENTESSQYHDDELTTLDQAASQLAHQVQQMETELGQKNDILESQRAKVADLERQVQTVEQQLTENSHHIQLESSQMHHLQDRIKADQAHITQLRKYQDEFDPQAFEQACVTLQARRQEYAQQYQTLTETVQQKTDQLRAEQQKQQALAESIQKSQNQLQIDRAEQHALQTLQQNALQQTHDSLQSWLDEHNLSDARHLGEVLCVDPKWQKAVEIVLETRLQGLCIHAISDYLSTLPALPAGQLLLVESMEFRSPLDNTLLAQVKQGGTWVAPWLAKVYIAEDRAEAEACRMKLAFDESVITPDGIWLGVNWAYVSKSADDSQGCLYRQARLDSLEQRIRAQQNSLEKFKADKAHLDQYIQEQTAALDRLKEEEQQRSTQLTQCQTELDLKQQKQYEAKHQHDQTENTIDGIQQQIKARQTEIHQAQQRYENARDQKHRLEKQHQKLQQKLKEAQQALQTMHDTYTSLKKQYEASVEQYQSARDRLHHAKAMQARAQYEQEHLQQQRDQIQSEWDALEDLKALEAELENCRHQRQESQSQRQSYQTQLSELEAERDRLTQERQQLEAAIENKRSELEALQLKNQTLMTQRDQYAERLEANQHTVSALLEALPESKDMKTLQNEIAATQKRIQKLGAVNLTAIDEYQAVSERQQYLDQQAADLEQALETLQQAIDRIDHQTRDQFKTTLKCVNDTFQTLFPEMFNGGQAYLRMTENDLLNAGLEIVAQPPGKRTASVHLLSGGEKALTAIALIFSLFQLNPAPFCILDEVDAPLDDVNVQRFGMLLQQMSEKVQFIIITHNKQTMTMVDTLVGVTMQEPGVSRLVTVSMEQALSGEATAVSEGS